ncbi:MAG: transposase zinc-binding domain-containing protein [bacterium]
MTMTPNDRNILHETILYPKGVVVFSCKGRWFCPSCHMKKVVQFGDFLNDNILYPLPHRQYVFTIPIRLRIYFRNDRTLLTRLCRCAYASLLEFFRTVVGVEDAVPGVVLTIHTFGDFPQKWLCEASHNHL